MEELYQKLSGDERRIWEEYQKFRVKGIKQKAAELLKTFIDRVKQNTSGFEDIAFALHTMNVRKEVEMQYPLFKELIYPTLVNLAKQQKPGSYKALARYEQYFHQDNKLTLQVNAELGINEKYFDTEAILKRELELNSTDKETAYLLANKIARSLDYAIHELPAGLLWDLKPFKQTIDEFSEILEIHQLSDDKWSQRISLLNAISHTWEAFLSQSKFKAYDEYLESINDIDSRQILNWPRSVIYDFDVE